MPAIDRLAAVLTGRAHVPPLFAKVTVTTVPTVAPVAEHEVKPVTRVIVGVAGIVNAELNVTVMVFALASAPAADVVNPTAHEAAVVGFAGVPVKVTVVTPVAAMVTFAGDTLVPSFEVRTLKPAPAYTAATGFVIPAIVTVPGVRPASAHVPPLFARVIVTTLLTVAPVALQFRKAALSVIVGVAGTVNAPSKVAVIVLPAARLPATVGVKPTVHAATVDGAVTEPTNVTVVTAVVAIVTFAGRTVVASLEVRTPNPAAA